MRKRRMRRRKIELEGVWGGEGFGGLDCVGLAGRAGDGKRGSLRWEGMAVCSAAAV